jgi:hypothetical protein
VRRVGSAFVIVAALAAGCGAQHRSMEDAVLYAVCGDRCKNVTVELSEVRRAGDYATADVSVKPAGRVQAAHYLLQQVHGDWASVDAWTSLGGLTCGEVGRQMRVPEPVLHRLAVC